jgi:Fe-S-cluster-containing dehydrogenase component
MRSEGNQTQTTPEGSRHAVVIDLDRCIGCWACGIACKMKNNLPEGQWWLRVETIGGGEWDVSSGDFPDPRKHYRPVIEQCAYSAGQAERGILPDCVKACPVDAMRFGERDRADSRVASDLQSADATHTGNPPGSAFTVTYLPARTQARQRRSGYVES